MWFDNLFASKQTITNAQMLQLSAKLYRLTNNADYLRKMNQLFDFIMNNEIINATTFLITDGVTANFTPGGVYGPTYNSGVMLGAMTEIYKLNKNTTYLDLSYNITFGLMVQYSNDEGVLVEYCETNCADDALMYKGLFGRNYLMDKLDDQIKHDILFYWFNLQIVSNTIYNVCDLDPITKCNGSYKARSGLQPRLAWTVHLRCTNAANLRP